MTDDFPQAEMLMSQNATKRVMVVLPMFNVDENNENHGMSPMFIELRSSAEVTSDFFPPAFSLSSSPVILQPMHQQIPSPRPSSTINEPTEECHFSTALNFSFVTGYIPRHEQFSKSAVQIQPSPLAMVNGQWCTGPSSNTKRKQLTMPKSFPHTT